MTTEYERLCKLRSGLQKNIEEKQTTLFSLQEDLRRTLDEITALQCETRDSSGTRCEEGKGHDGPHSAPKALGELRKYLGTYTEDKP